MSFELGKIYEYTIKDLSFGPLPKEILIDHYRDGRAAGVLMEYLVCSLFNEFIHIGKDTERDGDVLRIKDFKNEIFEVRTITKKGTSLIPSSMIGKGRKYNEDRYIEKLNKIRGFILVDITKFPYIRIISLNSLYALQEHGFKQKLTPKECEDLFKTLKTNNPQEISFNLFSHSP